MEIGNEKFRKERRDFDDLSETFEGNFRYFWVPCSTARPPHLQFKFCHQLLLFFIVG